MEKRERPEAISEYVLKRIDSQNGIVGTVLCAVAILTGIFISLWEFSSDGGGVLSLDPQQGSNILLVGGSVFAAFIFILSRNDERLSERRRHLLSTTAIIIFDAVAIFFCFFNAAYHIEDRQWILIFPIALLLVFGAMIYPFWFSLIAVPSIVIFFVIYIHLLAGYYGIVPYSLTVIEIMSLIIITVIVSIICLLNSMLQKKRFEVEGVYYSNVNTMLSAKPTAFSTVRVNVTRNEVVERIGKGLVANTLANAGNIEEMIDNAIAISPDLSEKAGDEMIYRDMLLKSYDEGKDFLSFNWSYLLENGKSGWVTTSVRLLQNPSTKDIEAIVCSESDERQHTESSILSILSELDYIQISTIDVEKRTITLYRSKGRINDGFFPERDYEEEVDAVFRRLSAEYAGEVAVSRRLMSLDTIVQMLSQKDIYQVRLDAGKSHYQETFRYLDRFKKTIVMTLQDITEILDDEEEKSRQMREALAQVRESSRIKGEFISRMSHDMRTPMSSIIGFSSLLERDKNDPKKIVSDAKSISSAANELLSLMSDVLDIVKLNSKENGLSEKEFSLKRTYERICAKTKELADPLSIDFSSSFTEVSHESFIGDEERIGQILSNIITFVMNRTGKGGHISFRVSGRSHPSGNEENISFEIMSDQLVLSRDYQEVLFEPFSHDENDTAKGNEIEGTGRNDTGLLLPISKTLTDIMGGNISVKSAPDEGCAFSVIIPLRFTISESLPSDPHEMKEDSDVFDGLKILAAEDNELNAVLLREIMAMKGADTEIHSDGEQVLSAFKYSPAGKFNVILMDVEMPVMDGHETARAIRALESDMSLALEKRREAATIPIIAMTANTFPEDVEKSLNAGMNDHVGKPVDIRKLGDAISKSLYKV